MNNNEIIDLANKYMGQKIVALCTRYMYWGVLSSLAQLNGEPALIFDAPCAIVEVSGISESNEPVCTDLVTKPLAVFIKHIEIVFQPKWVDAEIKAYHN